MALLNDLGFERVAGIFDRNKRHLIPGLQSRYISYAFHSIPTDDIRTKAGTEAREPSYGLLDENGSLRPEYAQDAGILFNDIEERLQEGSDELGETKAVTDIANEVDVCDAVS